MYCLVDMPEPAAIATTKVAGMLEKRMSGKLPAPAAPTAEKLKPMAAAPQGKTEVKKQTTAQKGSDLLKQLQAEGKAQKPMPGKLVPGAPGVGKGDWKTKYGGRSPQLDFELNKLQQSIAKLSPEQQAFWNEQINKQMNAKLAGRNGTPYSPARTNATLVSQAKAWQDLVKNGPPKELMNRIGEKRPAPAGMRPDVTSSGQRKWISPDDGLKYSGGKNGVWRQNRVSKLDTMRRLPAITDFRKEQQGKDEAWPTQKLSPREGLPKTVDEVLKGLSQKEKNAIVFNGLDATGNEGLKLRRYYDANPDEKEARLREIVQRWHDQGGRSGVSGKPVALPGLEPKAGEERSSVDHFQPISTNRAAALPAADMRRIADNYKNFLIAEEGPNSQRGARSWDSWLDKQEGGGAKPQVVKPPPLKSLSEDQREKISTATRMTNFRIDKRLNERQTYDDETNAKIKKANQEVVAPFEKMKPNEKAALSLYGQDGVKYYAQVNGLLRNGNFEGSTPEKKQMAEFIAGNLRTGLEKLPPAKVEQLERAVSGNFATSLGKLKPGDIIEDKGFGSYTNKGAPVRDTFFKKDQPNAAIRIVNPKTAREVAPVMEYSREGEHISMPGTRYRLVDVVEKGVFSRKTMGYIPQYTFEEVEG
jgi:hypothetical protein